MQEARGTLNLRIFVTHNFFVEKIALELLEMLTTTTSDGEIRQQQLDGGQFCCLTSFKLVVGNGGGNGGDKGGVQVTLIKAENDDHVESKSPV